MISEERKEKNKVKDFEMKGVMKKQEVGKQESGDSALEMEDNPSWKKAI